MKFGYKNYQINQQRLLHDFLKITVQGKTVYYTKNKLLNRKKKRMQFV